MSDKAVIDIKDQKSMIIVGIVAGVLIIYSAFFAHQLPYSFTQYLGYSFMKLVLFAVVVAITYVNPAIGVAALIALLSTFQYFYMQKAFRKNIIGAGRRLENDIKKVGRKIKKDAETMIEEDDDEDKKEAELKAEVAETMASIGNNTNAAYTRDNSYFMTTENNNYPELHDPRYSMYDNGTIGAQMHAAAMAKSQMQGQLYAQKSMNSFANPPAGKIAYQAQGQFVNPQANAPRPDCFGAGNPGNTFYPSFVNETNAAYDSQFQPASAGIDEYNFMQQHDRRNRA